MHCVKRLWARRKYRHTQSKLLMVTWNRTKCQMLLLLPPPFFSHSAHWTWHLNILKFYSIVISILFDNSFMILLILHELPCFVCFTYLFIYWDGAWHMIFVFLFVFFFMMWTPGNQTWVLRFRSKCHYLLGHLFNPCLFLRWGQTLQLKLGWNLLCSPGYP